MLCSKLHCQKGFNLILFAYQLRHLVEGSGETPSRAVRAAAPAPVNPVNTHEFVSLISN